MARTMAHFCVLICLVLLRLDTCTAPRTQDHSIDSGSELLKIAILGPGHSRVGIGPVNRDIMEMYHYKGTAYTRVYMAVLNDGGADGQGRLPKFKDIWQDTVGNIQVSPGEKITEVLWVSFGQARRQCFWAQKYKPHGQKKGKNNNPLVRSILVDTDAVLRISASAVSESYGKGFDMNVDRRFGANQFGLREDSQELLRQYALSGSLITYSYEDVPDAGRPAHWGLYRPLGDLMEKYGISQDPIPGFETIVSLQGEFLNANAMSAVHTKLSELYAMHTSKVEPRPNEEFQQLNDFYREYSNEGTTTWQKLFDERVPEWATQALISKLIAENVESYWDTVSPYQIPLVMQTLEAVDRDMLFTKPGGLVFSDIDRTMEEMLQKTTAHRELLRKREELMFELDDLTRMVAMESKPLSSSRFKGLLIRLRKKDNLLKEVLPSTDIKGIGNLELGFALSADQMNKLETVLQETIDSVLQAARLAVTSSEMEEISNAIGNQVNLQRDILKADTYYIIHNGDATTGMKLINLEKPVSGKKVLLRDQNRLREFDLLKGEVLPHEVHGVLRRDTKVTFVGEGASQEEVAQILRENFIGSRLMSISFQSASEGVEDSWMKTLAFLIQQEGGDEYNRRGIKTEYVTSVTGQVTNEQGITRFTKTQEDAFDAVANQMTSINSESDTTLFGTPVQFIDGDVIERNKVMPDVLVNKLKDVHGTEFAEAQRERFTGVKYFKTHDPLTQKDYSRLKDAPSVSEVYSRVRLLREGLLDDYNAVARSGGKYRNEVILQLGQDEGITQAATFLHNKLTEIPRGERWWVKYDGSVVTISGPTVVAGGQTHVSIVGRGDLHDGQLTVEGHDAAELAMIVTKLPRDSPGKTIIGRISVVACTAEADAGADDRFIDTFMKTLDDDHTIRAPVSVRHGLVQVDAEGDKQYWTVTDDGIEWRHSGSEDKTVANWVGSDQIETVVTDASRLNHLLSVATPDGLIAGEGLRVRDTEGYRASVTLLDSQIWAGRIYESAQSLRKQTAAGGEWVPILSSAEQLPDGQHRLELLDPTSMETREVITRDGTFSEFTEHLDARFARLQHVLDPTKPISAHGMIEHVDAVDGLNTGFFILGLTHWLQQQNDTDQEGISAELTKALEVHAYINFVQISHGVVLDLAKVVKLAETAIRFEGMALGSGFLLFDKVNKGIGVLTGIASIVLDSYELAHAQSDAAEGVFGTQLTFDVASLAMSLSGTAAGMIGATTTAATLGALAVPLAGFGIGISGLVQVFGQVSDNAEKVALYFDYLDKAYSSGGYKYEAVNGTLSFQSYAVIKEASLVTKRIVFDSQYIYRTHHGDSGSGKINYIAWAGDMPQMVLDKSQAINIRAGIGYGNTSSLPNPCNCSVIVLPDTPKSYISYSYNLLPGATTRHDPGMDVARRLEQDYRFDYDFYICPSEQIVSKIHHEYVPTEVKLELDSADHYLAMRKLPSEFHGKITYRLQGHGGHYAIFANAGVNSISLAGDPASNTSQWIIDVTNLTETDTMKVEENDVTVGGMSVHVFNTTQSTVFVRYADGEVAAVDFSNRNFTVVEIDFSRWRKTAKSLERHLEALHYTTSAYVVIDNYVVDDVSVGRAYFDSKNDRFLYTLLASPNDTQFRVLADAELVGVTNQSVYFLNRQRAAFWKVDIGTKRVQVQYELFQDSNYPHTISSVIHSGGWFIIKQQFTDQPTDSVVREDTYFMKPGPGDKPLLTIVSSSYGEPQIPLPDANCSDQTPVSLNGRSVGAGYSSLVEYTVHNSEPSRAQRVWYQLNGTTVVNEIRPNIEEPNIRADSLNLAGIMHGDLGQEVYMFFYPSLKHLYEQTGSERANRRYIDHLENVVALDNAVVAVTGHDLLLQILPNSTTCLAAISAPYLFYYRPWWEALDRLNTPPCTSIVTIMGIGSEEKDAAAHHAILQVWYDVYNRKLIMCPPDHNGHGQSRYIGLATGGSHAWLYDDKEGRLMVQETFQPANMSEYIHRVHDKVYVKTEANLTTPRVFATGLKSAQLMGGRIRAVSDKGLVLSIDQFGTGTVLSVTPAWVEEHADNVQANLSELVQSGVYQYGEVIGVSGDPHSWYHVEADTLLSPPVLNGVTPDYLGFHLESSTAYFFYNNLHKIYALQNTSAVMFCAARYTYRTGRTLLLQAAPAEEGPLLVPVLDHMELVVMTGDTAPRNSSLTRPENTTGTEFHISLEAWLHYGDIAIEEIDDDASTDIYLNATLPCNFYVAQQGNKTMVVDPHSAKLLVLKKSAESLALSGGVITHTSLHLCGVDATKCLSETARHSSCRPDENNIAMRR